jgi:Spy/CpxP family protein refolding chaperone
MTRTRASLVLLGVFLLGVVSGVFATGAFVVYRFRHGGPSQVEDLVVQRLARRLQLDAAQRQQLEKVAERTRGEISQVMSEVRPRVESIMERAYQDLGPSLRPDQQRELDKVHEETKERLARFRMGRP